MDDPAVRVRRLLEVCKELPGRLVLVGSSLGAHVCMTAAGQLPVRGVFVLAPAFFMPGYEQYTPKPPPGCPVTIVHGWNDTIVPPENSVRYAQQYRCDSAPHRFGSPPDRQRRRGLRVSRPVPATTAA